MEIQIELMIQIGMVIIAILGCACIFMIAKIINRKRKLYSKVKQARKEKIEW